MSDAREFDIVLLGATGFTGRLVAHHLHGRLAGTRTRWVVAGRDRSRLDALAAELDGAPDVEVVDVRDLVGLLDLAGRTRVLATTVGPYAERGELVVQACVRSGTHYADITGEPAFVGLMRERYDRDARRRGVAIVTCCGFDSVPADLGTRFTVAQLPDDVPVDVRAYVRASGQLSGGTAATALGAVAAGVAGGAASDDGVAGGAGSDDGVAGGAGKDDGVAPRREVRALPRRIHRVAELGGWGVPLPTIDPAIVMRSARELDGYGTRFRYGHFARVRRLPTVLAGVAALGAMTGMAATTPTRAALRRVLPDPGDGPDAATRERSRFEVTFLATGGEHHVVTRFAGGDPGYGETSRMLGEAALTLAGDARPDEPGVRTPAAALGWPYLDRLVEQGLRVEVVRPDDHRATARR